MTYPPAKKPYEPPPSYHAAKKPKPPAPAKPVVKQKKIDFSKPPPPNFSKKTKPFARMKAEKERKARMKKGPPGLQTERKKIEPPQIRMEKIKLAPKFPPGIQQNKPPEVFQKRIIPNKPFKVDTPPRTRKGNYEVIDMVNSSEEEGQI